MGFTGLNRFCAKRIWTLRTTDANYVFFNWIYHLFAVGWTIRRTLSILTCTTGR